MPIDATPAERGPDRQGLQARRWPTPGLVVPMATTNLFGDPDLQGRRVHRRTTRSVRAYALQKTMNAIDLGRGVRREGLRLLGRPRGRRDRRHQERRSRPSSASATP
ncbi:MAG: hypothetical protein MZV63_16015 [Marinilabiliales bacterium]|nr:hypothetical protein [Marinilabiliales bacterium]